ncbi:hypothetical protein SAMN03080603_00513 [Acetomicrobium thermoterrenum DSM 13490]|uniref:Probable membrane transporter protein n=1 Tax=Acetomicrobium thermoterrenum DSM 13490 TaxID=1120987 RepID=A0A1H3E9A7_9BACT|nr:sulfite exporter TauE/SafE family protein [Acetomicrobium thermoterrenum]SDX75342.1 hypothetical protein SAMN03080603_00513 [Acetomicrobium thermoterrenum DSM 13490]
MSILSVALVIAVGFCSGFLNVLAGGGSLLTIPLLVFMGLDVSVANATNRVGVLFQNVFAAQHFHKKSLFRLKDCLFFGLPSLLGAALGTFGAVSLDERYLRIAVAVLICCMAVLLVLKPDMWEREREISLPRWVLILAMFLIGIYGGFIQAGVGFLLLWALVGLGGKDLLHANALKVVVIAMFTTLSLAIFLLNGMVNFPLGVVLAIGNFMGGIAGAHFAILKGNRWLRLILSVVVTVSAIRMLLSL